MFNLRPTPPSKVKEAYINNEFYEYITGRKGYGITEIMVPVDVPTDWTRAIPRIYDLYNETKDDGVVVAFQDGIRKAINGSEIDIWCACNTLFFHCSKEMSGKAPFVINSALRKELRSVVIEKPELLENAYYGCYKDNEHVYNDILRLNRNFMNRYGCELLG